MYFRKTYSFLLLHKKWTLLGAMLFLVMSFLLLSMVQSNQPTDNQTLGIKVQRKPTEKRTITQKPKPSLSPTSTATPMPSLRPTFQPTQLLFGMGPEADQALQTRLVKEAPVKMLSSWYNSPNDLAWITKWKYDLVPQSYAKGYVLHVITFTDHPEIPLQTAYGPACGREYPLSPRFADDMKQLAQTFTGSGRLYVTLFTELQTYPCSDNEWIGSENYYKALKDQYRVALQIWHQYAPNAKVGLSFGGWQSRWDEPTRGGGRSFFPYFADVIKESDIVAFQAMQSDTNKDDILAMTKLLAGYGKPVLLSHFKPDNGSQVVFDADVRTMFTDEYMSNVKQSGLIGISFMDTINANGSEDTYQFVKNAVTRYSQ